MEDLPESFKAGHIDSLYKYFLSVSIHHWKLLVDVIQTNSIDLGCLNHTSHSYVILSSTVWKGGGGEYEERANNAALLCGKMKNMIS